jgi:hypothetical protein
MQEENGTTTHPTDPLASLLGMAERALSEAQGRERERATQPALSITREGGLVVIRAVLPVEHAAAAIQACSTAHLAVLGLQPAAKKRGRPRKDRSGGTPTLPGAA